MELKQIKEMMAAMTRHGMKRLVIKQDEFELELERECASSSPQVVTYSHAAPLELHRGHDIPVASSIPMMGTPRVEEDVNSRYVTSPMVGTFYSSPAPEEPFFVKVGDRVDADTVVCIIEAMKVMNEVKAGVTGTVVEILTENGHPVEFGTKLYRIN